MKFIEFQWKSLKINEHLIKINEIHWNSLKIIENHWKSKGIIENQWKSLEINGIQYQISRKSRPDFPIQVLFWILKWKLFFWGTCVGSPTLRSSGQPLASAWQPQWKSMKIIKNQWKSMKIKPNQWNSMRINKIHVFFCFCMYQN